MVGGMAGPSGLGMSTGGGGPQPQPGMPSAPPPKPPKTYTLTKDANFNVIVKVSRNWENRRDDEASFLSGLIDKNPMFMGWFGDMMLRNTDGPGHEEAADRVEVMLDPKIQAMRTQKQQGIAMPPEATAQIAQMKQQLDQAHQIMGKAQSELKDKTETHQRQMENDVKIAQIESDRAIKIQAMKDATAIRVAELGAKKDLIAEAHEDQEEAIALASAQAHEHTQGMLDRQHQVDQAQMGHQQALEQGQQPPPMDPNKPPPQPEGQPTNRG